MLIVIGLMIGTFLTFAVVWVIMIPIIKFVFKTIWKILGGIGRWVFSGGRIW